jgi:hypothetical protein
MTLKRWSRNKTILLECYILPWADLGVGAMRAIVIPLNKNYIKNKI